MSKLEESLEEIQRFWKEEPLSFDGGSIEKLRFLEKQKHVQFPIELKEYFSNVISNKNIYFETVGNPISLLSTDKISWKMNGYNFNPVSNSSIEGWDDSWFLIGDEGGDPIIINLNEKEATSNVYTAMHGAGEWNFNVVSNSIAQFLTCAAAVHTALTAFDLEDPIIDDKNGFNLAEEPAKFLFPYIKKIAPTFYSDWVSVFDNS